jgi:hypothetical protein
MSLFFDFLRNFTSAHAALLISILAILASLRANSTSKKSYDLSAKALADTQRRAIYEKRSATLGEIDSQNAKFGTLLAILADSLNLFRENPQLQEVELGQLERIRQNVLAVQQLRSKYEEQRELAASFGDGADPARMESILASIKDLQSTWTKILPKKNGVFICLKIKQRTV